MNKFKELTQMETLSSSKAKTRFLNQGIWIVLILAKEMSLNQNKVNKNNKWVNNASAGKK